MHGLVAAHVLGPGKKKLTITAEQDDSKCSEDEMWRRRNVLCGNNGPPQRPLSRQGNAPHLVPAPVELQRGGGF